MIEIGLKGLLVAALLLVLMGRLSSAVRERGLPPEWGRKLLHLGMGTLTFCAPWLMGRSAPVLIPAMAAIAGAWLFAVRFDPRLRARFGAALHAVDRPSFGEIHFAAGAAASYFLARGDNLCFALPMALLTFADTAAAITGKWRGAARHPIGINGKSVEGCAAFFAVAVICAVAALSLASQLAPAARFAVAIQLAFDLGALEIIGTGGADNLLIPVGGACLLPLLLGGGPLPFAVHLGLAVVVMALWRGRPHNTPTRQRSPHGT